MGNNWIRCAAIVAVLLGGAAIPTGAGTLVTSKVIYGNDDRIDVYQESDPDILAWAASTCALVNASNLTDNGDGTFTMRTSNFTYLGRTPCEGEPFAGQPTAPYCSGFLAGENIIATAGHCVNSGNLPNVRFVFGFVMTDASNAVTLLNADQVYRGSAVLGYQNSGDFDYSVVQLDRVVTAPGACPLPIRREGTVPLGANIGVIGHPSGLPMKIAFGAQTVVKANSNTGYFIANLDTYGGNSGSPVFNATTGVVEGVLVRGERDYNIVGSCFESNRISNDSGGEDVSKSTTFDEFIPDTIPACRQVEAPHTADLDGNGKIELSELLRLIQIYNASAYHCDETQEDGFDLGVGDTGCVAHDSDYITVDFAIELSELLRGVQLYNAGSYAACNDGEDGFCTT